MDSFVEFDDFGDFDDTIVSFTDTPVAKKVVNEKKYDFNTMQKYKSLRISNLDPLTFMDIPNNCKFKFPYEWDPYTGERLGVDNNGPLCFDPDVLIKHFHTQRLNKLWIEPSDTQLGYYSGIYDDAVGIGFDFELKSRGLHPEWYIFRLPIIDCYLTEDHNKQFITMGPILTDEEIAEIDRLASLREKNYKQLFGVDRPSLKKIKNYYDNSISKKPIIPPTFNGENENQELYDKVNRYYVELLKKIKG